MKSAIKIDHLCRVFGDRTVLDDINFEVSQGQIHGFLGPNGAGKSTTMKIIAGIIAPTSGSVEIQGSNVTTQLHEVKKKIGILPENPPLYADMTVQDYLNFSLELRSIKNKSNLEYALEKTHLTEVRKRLIGNLSKGFKQRVGVAQAIICKPPIIILDEPTVGLDPASILEMRSLIKSLAPDHTVVYSSHQLHEVSLTCSHITIINNGKIVTTGAMNEIEQKFDVKKKLHIETNNITDHALKFLKEKDFIKDINMTDNNLSLHISGQEDRRAEIVRLLVERNVNVYEVVSEKVDLEDIFLQLTKEEKKR
jgi:ABC-2 type transport system ATP-binding protein